MKRGIFATLASVALMLLGPGLAQAAPPANDAYAAATPLAVGQEISATNLESTSEPSEPATFGVVRTEECNDRGIAITADPQCGVSVWFLFKAPESTNYTFETCDEGTDIDTIVALFTGASAAAAVKVGEDDDDGGECAGGSDMHGSRLTLALTAGTEYRLGVYGFHGERGSFYVRAYQGVGQPRTGPDTAIDRRGSFAALAAPLSADMGVLSGSRHSASFPLYSTPAGGTFECSLDGAAFAACSSPVSYDTLAPGSSHVFKARATVSGVTDPTPAVERFTIDTTPPETSFTSATTGDTALPKGEWVSATSERNWRGGSFTCGIDDWTPIDCGFTQEIEQLCKGPHTFRSAAWDLASNPDPTPATAQFNVTTGTACAPPTIETPTPAAPGSTSAEVDFKYKDNGAGGTLHMDYGPTTAYGMTGRDQPAGPSGALGGDDYFILANLEPSTQYHYRVTLTTPFGTASTGDQTVTTKAIAAGSDRATIQNGNPVIAGLHAATIPFTIDAHGFEAGYRLLIAADEKAGDGARELEVPAAIPAGSTGVLARSIQIVDLDPGVTYHYRVVGYLGSPETTQSSGPEGTFVTDPAPPKKEVARKNTKGPKHFSLTKRWIRLGKLTRKSKKLIVRLINLPASTRVTLKLTVGKSKQTARKKARRNGSVMFRPSLSKRIRKALLDETVKKFKLKVTAAPPGLNSDSVTLTQKLKPLG